MDNVIKLTSTYKRFKNKGGKGLYYSHVDSETGRDKSGGTLKEKCVNNVNLSLSSLSISSKIKSSRILKHILVADDSDEIITEYYDQDDFNEYLKYLKSLLAGPPYTNLIGRHAVAKKFCDDCIPDIFTLCREILLALTELVPEGAYIAELRSSIAISQNPMTVKLYNLENGLNLTQYIQSFEDNVTQLQTMMDDFFAIISVRNVIPRYLLDFSSRSYDFSDALILNDKDLTLIRLRFLLDIPIFWKSKEKIDFMRKLKDVFESRHPKFKADMDSTKSEGILTWVQSFVPGYFENNFYHDPKASNANAVSNANARVPNYKDGCYQLCKCFRDCQEHRYNKTREEVEKLFSTQVPDYIQRLKDRVLLMTHNVQREIIPYLMSTKDYNHGLCR